MRVEDELKKIYALRFGNKTEMRRLMWETLTEGWFQRYVQPTDTVVDLAAGYCEFINSIHCGRKIAIDANETVKEMAGDDVEVFNTYSTDLPDELSGEVDVVFVSNFFEHLSDKNEFLDTLREIHRVLRPGGSVLVLQPNIKLTKGAYWDFVDHSLPITEKSLAEALEITGFTIEYTKTRFLPYTASSGPSIIAHPALVKLYLKVWPAHYLFGKQTFMVARKP